MSEKIEHNVSFKQPIEPDRIELIPSSSPQITIKKEDLLKLNIDTSVKRYVDQCSFTFKDPKFCVFDKISEEEKTEIKVIGLVALSQGITEVFHGYVYECKKQWDNKSSIQIVHVDAKGLPIVLAKKILYNFELAFTHGYGEVIKNLLKSFPIFNINNVLEEPMQGRIYFDNISVLDAIRQLAYIKKWCLYFQGTNVSFKPCEKLILDEPIYESDIDYGTITKRVM